MKNLNYKSILAASAVALAVCLAGPAAALAATAPSLGAAATFGIVSSTYTNSLNAGLQTNIVGDTCYTTGPGTAPISYSTVPTTPCTNGADQASALATLNGEACTPISGALDAVTIGTNPPGTFPPGCYSMVGAMNITLSTNVTLDLTAPGGDGGNVWIFRSTGALTTGANSNVVLAHGANANNVFWTPGSTASIGANAATTATPTFVGTIIEDALGSTGITIGHFANLLGRALAFGHTVTTDSNTISVPPVTTTLTVVKVVVGGSKVISDFSLFIDGGAVTSGAVNTVAAGLHTVSETADSGYTSAITGDCAADGTITLTLGDARICTITNTVVGATSGLGGGNNYFSPPLISVVKVPAPLALPVGGGTVTYNYTLRNIGLVPVSKITMVDDSCSPLALVSGDVNGNSNLDLNETWTYTCSTHLSATHTNNVVATGWYNGVSTTDIANATVVVGLPIVPPLIHVIKVPSPMTLPAGGGMVTYIKSVTNPGTVPLSNVQISDDKCGPVQYISGDANGDAKLDPTETWIYSCQTNLTQTTTNTVTVSGDANGMTARDFAIATVVVNAAPMLPNTGLPPGGNNVALIILLSVVALAGWITVIVIMKKRKI